MTVKEKISALIHAGHTIAVAESCTGGGVGAAFTDISGSSHIFRGGVIAYANEVKVKILNVPEEMLAEHGAVSEPVARCMAESVRILCDAEIAVATTGIAGPDGGTEEKPVGTVWFACATAHITRAEKKIFTGSREDVRTSAVAYAVTMVYDSICIM